MRQTSTRLPHLPATRAASSPCISEGRGISERRAVRLRCKAAALRSNESGANLIEYALGLTVLFTLTFCFMELCMVYYSYDLIEELAREGTRYAMVRGATCPTATSPTCEVTASQVNSYVSSLSYPNPGGGTITPNTSYPDGNESVGSRVQVTVTYVFPIRMPFVPKSSLTMSNTSVMRIVQ